MPGLLASAPAAAGDPAPGATSLAPAIADEAPWVPGPVIAGTGELTAVTASPGTTNLVAFGVDPSSGRTTAYGWEARSSDRQVRSIPVPDVGRVLDADFEWALGERGVLRQIDGAWQVVSIARTPGAQTLLTGVTARPDGTWAVGVERSAADLAAGAPGRGVVQQWDGAVWRQVPIPAALLGPRSELTAVTVGVGVLVFGLEHARTGDRAIALKFDGTDWASITVPTRVGNIDHLTTASYHDVGGWTAPAGAPAWVRRPVMYQIDTGTGALTPAPVQSPLSGEVTGVALDYGMPVAVGVTALDMPFGLQANFLDDGFAPWTRVEVTALRGRVNAVQGDTRGNLFAVGYQQLGRTRRPLVLGFDQPLP